MKLTLPCLALTGCVLAGPAHAQGTLLDATFDGISNGVLEDFSFLGNTDAVAAGGAWSQSDGDGATNRDEFIAGTDPNDRSDMLRIVNLAREADTLSVSWPSVLDRHYELFWSSDSTTWTTYSTHPGTGGLLSSPLDLVAIDSADGTPGKLTRLFVRIGVSR